MNLERLLVRLRQIFLLLGGGLTIIGAVLTGLSLLLADPADLTEVRAETSDCASTGDCGPIQYAVDDRSQLAGTPPVESTIAPLPLADALSAPTATLEPATPAATIVTINDTLPITKTEPALPAATPAITATRPLSAPIQASADLVAEESYTSTAQVSPRTEPTTGAREAGAANLQAQSLPPDERTTDGQTGSGSECPTNSTASFDLIPVQGPPAEHPDIAHGDLNLTRRGYEVVPEALGLLFFAGATDPDAPQLSRLFGRSPTIKAAYRVNDWIWDSSQCGGGRVHGCPGPVIADWEVTMVGLATSPGEPVAIPDRNAAIYSGGFKALVLYADDRQITLGYTRHDSVAGGYVVHLLGICVDPNLLALYRAQNDDHGWRATGHLPALRSGQIIGTAQGDELKVAVRDNGSFMDPRSSKDWWRGY
jgi:hypothetical protein